MKLILILICSLNIINANEEKLKSVDAKSLFNEVKTSAKKTSEKTTIKTRESLDPSRFKSKFIEQKRSNNINDVSKLLNNNKTTTNLPKKSSVEKILLDNNLENENKKIIKNIDREIKKEFLNIKDKNTYNKVKTLITIDKDGKLRYKIIKFSDSISLNKKVKKLLEKKIKENIKYKNKRELKIIINFKKEN